MGSRSFGASTALVPFVVLVASGSAACSNDASSCDELREQFERFQPKAADAWEDIAVLAEDVEQGLELERRLREECAADDLEVDREAPAA